MITRIYIDNFRCFSNFEFKPARINLLLGPNGSGKSSLIDLLDRIASLVLDGQEVVALFADDDLTRWDSRLGQRFEFDLELDGEVFTYASALERDSAGGGMALRSEQVTCDGRILFHYEEGEVYLHRNDGSVGTHFPFRGNRSFIAGIEERPETTDLIKFLTRLRGLRSYKLMPAGMSSVTQEEEPLLRKNGSNFASWYRHLAQERAGDIPELFARLSEAVPGFRALVLKGAGKQGRTRDLVVQMRAEGQRQYEVDFDAVSDGQRALIILYTLLVDVGAAPRTLLLDEPENFVGLAELQPWLQHLDDALGDTGQFLLISHHPEVIDFLAAESPNLFERPGDGPVRVRPADFERESGLRASEQVARGLVDAR